MSCCVVSLLILFDQLFFLGESGAMWGTTNQGQSYERITYPSSAAIFYYCFPHPTQGSWLMCTGSATDTNRRNMVNYLTMFMDIISIIAVANHQLCAADLRDAGLWRVVVAAGVVHAEHALGVPRGAPHLGRRGRRGVHAPQHSDRRSVLASYACIPLILLTIYISISI